MGEKNFLKLIILFICLLVGSVLTIVISLVDFKVPSIKIPSKYELELNEKVKNSYTFTDEYIKSLSIDEKERLLISEKEYYGIQENKNNSSELDIGIKEIDSDLIESTEKKYIDYFSHKNYVAVIDNYDSLRIKYDLTVNEAKDLRYMYDSATNMYNLTSANNKNVISNFLGSFKEPRTFILSVLSFPEKERREVFISDESLNPVYEGTISILNYEKLSEDKDNIIVDEARVSDFYKEGYDNYSLHKIELSIQAKKVHAYIAQDELTSVCKIYRIDSIDGYSNNFKTLKEFKSLNY